MSCAYDDCRCGRRKTKGAPCCIRCSNAARAEGMVPPDLADYARRRFSEGYGPRVIAFEALRDGLIEGVRLDCLIVRLVKWRRRAGIPLLRERKALSREGRSERAADARRMVSAQREEEREARIAAALKLVRPDTPCAWCDCTRPGRACIECGRVAPGRQA